MKLNKKRPFGQITGAHEKFPNARFSQDGALFSGDGTCLTLDGNKKFVAGSKEDKDAQKAASDRNENVGNELVAMAKDLKKLDKAVLAAEKKLEKRKAADMEKPSYTSGVSEAQKNLSNLKRKRTKLNNQAAVLETSAIAED